MAELTGHGWLRGQALSVALEPRGATLHLVAVADRLDVAGLVLRDLTLDCPLQGLLMTCPDGRVGVTLPDGTRLAATAALKYGNAGVSLTARASGPGAAGWRCALDSTPDGRWKVQVETRGIDLARVHASLPPAWSAALPPERWPASLAGSTALSATATGNAAGPRTLDLQATVAGLAFSATDAAEQAGLALGLQATRNRGAWGFRLHGRHDAGVLYLVPGFTVGGGLPGLLLDTAAGGVVEIAAAGEWSPEDERLTLERFSLGQGADLRLQARARIRAGRAEELGLTLPSTPFARLYRNWLQPFLAGTFLDSLEGKGHVGLELRVEGARQDIALDFTGLDLADTRGRFGVRGLDGRMAAGPAHAGRGTNLAIEELALQGLPLGPMRLPLEATGDGLRLVEASELQLLDGRFLLEAMSLTLGGEGDRHTELRFAGVLTPVSLPALCEALGLPRAAGQFSGVLPEVRWTPDRIRLDGDLLLRLFDGHIVARDLVVLDPFGTLPELATDLDVERIDLDLLTRESRFGRIRGRIGGHVKGLRLQGWQPVAMDLYLATPEDDDRPHRISQRAVASLSALSGGGAGLLSSGLMRIFSEYSYGRLGVGCRLVDGICEVRGVERSDDGGVVLVSRGGLLPPWIEVRASGRALAWKSLMEIYRRIESGELVVQ